jgi:hypothetical protein
VRHEPYGDKGNVWRYQELFSHQDPTVILPIMERYNVYPFKFNGEWIAVAFGDRSTVSAKLSEAKHTNPRTATAMAVIKAKEMGLI